MRVLALETSSSNGSIALVEVNDDPLAAELVASATARVSNAHGESLLPLVESVLRSARVELSAIDLLAVGVGPGSFTGTRIAVATAKGIAIASDKPLRGVDAFAALAIDAGTDLPLAVAIDARKSEVFVSAVRVVDGLPVRLVEPAHLRPEHAFAHVAGYVGETFVAVGDGAALVPELVPARRPRVGREVPTAFAVGALAGVLQRRQPVNEVDVLEPLYVRPPDVTMPTRTPGLRGPTT